MTSTLRLGQILKGSLSTYTITKQLHSSIWLATNLAGEKTIVKSVQHWRLENERDVLKRFQGRAPGLRPLVDEIVGEEEAPAIVLSWFEDDALNVSGGRRFTRGEVKEESRESDDVGWGYGMDTYEIADVKLDNILVNYNPQKTRISTACLADLGNTVPKDSKYAKDGFPIGAPIFRSPEAALRLPWGCSTDIWPLGTTLISLIWGLNWHIFKPDVPADHEDYEEKIVRKHCQYFGPYPISYAEIADEDTLQVLVEVMEAAGPVSKPFHLIREAEISEEDKAFLGKMMKLDPRDRPTATELLRDEWFADLGDDFPSGKSCGFPPDSQRGTSNVDAIYASLVAPAFAIPAQKWPQTSFPDAQLSRTLSIAFHCAGDFARPKGRLCDDSELIMDSSVKQPQLNKKVKRLWITKLSLRCVAIVFCLIIVGCCAATYGNPMLIGPAGGSLLWNIAEGTTLIIRRRAYKGIHPGACVGMDLVLWLALGGMSGFEAAVFLAYDAGSYFDFIPIFITAVVFGFIVTYDTTAGKHMRYQLTRPC
ncbi:hypothetical protein V502_07148 [Pseudogymnoascus sp. VKM F-4520 (FW-2644)]|nr:hypothetical protein V502_07148 [Pseudogymnoascus sp. VKM F-4520 (FW-2644)]